MDDLQAAPLAVLFDSDNVSAKHAEAVLDEAAKYGRPTVLRAYGDFTDNRLGGWRAQLLARAIQPIQQFAYTPGKNATDFSLVIDAMDLLYAGHVDGFVLVSSDSDFTRLALRLRESGKPVYGIGRKATPTAFQQACTQFIHLENLDEPPAEPDPDPGAEPVADQEPKAPDLRRLLTTAIGNAASDNGWARLGALGQVIVRSYAAFDARTYGHKRLSDLVRAQTYVEVRSGGDPSDGIWVRIKPPATKATGQRAAKKAAAKTAKTAKTAKQAPPEVEAETEPPVETPVEPAVASKAVTTTRTRTRSTAKKAASTPPS